MEPTGYIYAGVVEEIGATYVLSDKMADMVTRLIVNIDYQSDKR